MNILIPGRHHLLTDFQFMYLRELVDFDLQEAQDVDGNPLRIDQPVTRFIFAVTSADHSNTRRNPVPFHLRAMALLDFTQELETPSFVYGIDDVGRIPDFAGYTLKKIRHESEGHLDLNPENTIVACSTPVLEMYERLGFRILPVELTDRANWQCDTNTPWELVERIGQMGNEWAQDELVREYVHEASLLIWEQYALGRRVQMLFRDDMIGADGDLTETRDYNSYVRQMDEIAELKYRETAPFVRPGRIGDIGCAAGSWIQLASRDPRFHESDLYGIEVAQQLYRICLQRKENGEFAHPYVFFSQKNAVTSLCFEPNSMHTIHTSSLTHEIESYGDREDLQQFIHNRFQELAPGGVWVNRDVVGPHDGDREVHLWLRDDDGRNEDWEKEIAGRDELGEYLEGLSTRALFLRFVQDFRRKEGENTAWEMKNVAGTDYAVLRLADAMEFISKKDYHGNWNSEMHERFCFWSFADWQQALEEVGFHIDGHSRAYRNEWLVENRFEGKVKLFVSEEDGLKPVPFPVTHMLMVAERRM